MKQEQSRFARALQRMLDETNLFDRYEWALFFEVSIYVIESWVRDGAFPRRGRLRMLIFILEHATDIPVEPLLAFKELEKLPAVDVTPLAHMLVKYRHHGGGLCQTIAEYRNETYT